MATSPATEKPKYGHLKEPKAHGMTAREEFVKQYRAADRVEFEKLMNSGKPLCVPRDRVVKFVEKPTFGDEVISKQLKDDATGVWELMVKRGQLVQPMLFGPRDLDLADKHAYDFVFEVQGENAAGVKAQIKLKSKEEKQPKGKRKSEAMVDSDEEPEKPRARVRSTAIVEAPLNHTLEAILKKTDERVGKLEAIVLEDRKDRREDAKRQDNRHDDMMKLLMTAVLNNKKD